MERRGEMLPYVGILKIQGFLSGENGQRMEEEHVNFSYVNMRHSKS